MSNKEQQYDATHNEGGEGYNPIRVEREQAEINRTMSIEDRRCAIERTIELKSSRVARQSGTFDQSSIDALNSQLANLDDDERAELAANGWTVESTTERRAAWNAKAKAGQITPRNFRKIEASMGWKAADLKRAITLYSL